MSRMSSSGVNPINSGPLLIRTALEHFNPSTLTNDNTYLVGLYDYPVSSNRILITSSFGVLAPTDHPFVSSLAASSIQISSLLDRDGFIGASGEVLHTDGTTVYWGPSGAGTGYWSEIGSTIYNNNGGFVGVNTSTPQYQLDVSGSFNVFGTETISTVTGGALRFTSQNNNSFIQSGLNLSNGSGNLLYFSNIDNVLRTMTVDTSNQRVGIGTINPQYTLDVSGNVNIFGTETISTSAGGALRFTAAANQSYIETGNNLGGGGGVLRFTTINAVSTLATMDFNNMVMGVGTPVPEILLQVGSTLNSGYYGTTNNICTMIIGPAITPCTSINPADLNNNFQGGLLVATTSTAGTNVGGGLTLGGRQNFDTTLTAFARVGGVAADVGIGGDFTVETLLQTSGATSALIERMRIKNTGQVGIGTANPTTALEIASDIGNIYNTPGSYTIQVPFTAETIEFEMVGAGGPFFDNSNISGTGGYIKGIIDVTSFQGQLITIVVGEVGDSVTIGSEVPSGASYITIPTTGPLFVIAGAGGSASSAGAPQYGGWGGGWSSLPPVTDKAIGGDGETAGGGVGGQGGQIAGGGSAGSCGGFGGNPGDGRPMPETYEEAAGGVGFGVPGGNGYTGGGGGCGGGGGSSYYNALYTTITASYPGNTLPSGTLPGYGRSSQNGYVSIQFTATVSLKTDGIAVIGGGSIQNNYGPFTVGAYMYDFSANVIPMYPLPVGTYSAIDCANWISLPNGDAFTVMPGYELTIFDAGASNFNTFTNAGFFPSTFTPSGALLHATESYNLTAL